MIIKKLKSKKAFSLVEMLCVTIVIVLMTAGMITTIQLATNSYNDSVMRSESEILASTLTTKITDELRYAGNTTIDSDGKITTIFSQNYGSLVGKSLDGGSLGSVFDVNSSGYITLGGNLLVSGSIYTYGLEVSNLKVQYESGIYGVSFDIVSGSKIITSKHFTVKPVNSDKITVG